MNRRSLFAATVAATLSTAVSANEHSDDTGADEPFWAHSLPPTRRSPLLAADITHLLALDSGFTYSELIVDMCSALGLDNPRPRVLDYRYSVEAQSVYRPEELVGVGGFYDGKGNFIALVTAKARDPLSNVLSHELAHAVLRPPIYCYRHDYRTDAYDTCIHTGKLRYLARDLWEATKVAQGYDKDYWTFSGCDDRELSDYDSHRKQGVNGPGMGFPIAWVSSAKDADGDGIVCEDEHG